MRNGNQSPMHQCPPACNLGAGIISVPRGLSAGETRDVAIAIRDASAVPNKVTGGS